MELCKTNFVDTCRIGEDQKSLHHPMHVLCLLEPLCPLIIRGARCPFRALCNQLSNYPSAIVALPAVPAVPPCCARRALSLWPLCSRARSARCVGLLRSPIVSGLLFPNVIPPRCAPCAAALCPLCPPRARCVGSLCVLCPLCPLLCSSCVLCPLCLLPYTINHTLIYTYAYI